MPPLVEGSDVSDNESSGGNIPFQDAQSDIDDKVNGNEDEEEVEEEDVYVVERIVGHEFKKDGTLLLQVKWKGYENPEDQTLEPEENLLEGAHDAVDEYFKVQGGRPEKPGKKRKSVGRPKATSPQPAKRKRSLQKESSPTRTKKTRSTPKRDSEDNESEKSLPDWVPKTKSWEDQIKSIDTIMNDADKGGLCAYLVWNNGKKSKVSVQQCYERCPMKMLKFYESHLVFKNE